MGRTLSAQRLASNRTSAPRLLRGLFRAVLLLACALVALALQPAHGQTAEPTNRVFLPLVSVPAGPPTSIRFGTALIEGQLLGEASSFAYGRTTLYYEVRVENAAGQPYSEEWTLNGQPRPELNRTGTLPLDGGPYASGFGLSTMAPLPRGTYQVRVRVNGLIGGVAQAIIE